MIVFKPSLRKYVSTDCPPPDFRLLEGKDLSTLCNEALLCTVLSLDAGQLHICGSQTWWYSTINFFFFFLFKAFAWGFCLDHFGLKPGNLCYMNRWCASLWHLPLPHQYLPQLLLWLHGVGWGGVEVPYDAGRRAWVCWQGLKWTAVTLLPHSRVALRTVMREIIPIGTAVSATLVCPFRMEGEVA